MPDTAIPAEDLGVLPCWNLDDLYPGTGSAALAADLARAEAEAKEFRGRYQGGLAALDGAALGAAIRRYEAIQEILARIGSYAGLLQAGDQADPEIGRFCQTMRERTNAIGVEILFFTLELNKLEDPVLEAKLEAPELAHYAPWLRDLRVFRPHQLSDELEQMLYEKYVVGEAAWCRLYDETVAALRFPVGGRELAISEALNLLTDADRARRREAGESLARGLAKAAPTFGLIINTLAKDKEIDDRWRHYPQPISFRNRANQVEDPVVEALIAAVKAAYPRLAHRYYRLKAQWLGLERLEHYDRNAPLPQAPERMIRWDEAQAIVLEAYGDFSPRMAAIGRRFFDERWIDAPTRPGKAQGAFSHSTVPSVHPYILLNYLGRTRDVMTIAHELGHGVHQVLAGRQGALMADTPLTLAETASVFGEMLTFRKLLARAATPAERRVMLASKVEDMINTVVRQIAFVEFERRLHDERRAGELTAQRLGDLWLEVQSESLGPAFHFDEDYRVYWTYIRHFIHSPFYVYAYAFGDCLVNSLYAVYEERPDGFAERYLAMLAAGGTLRHRELLAPFGLDAGDPGFWRRGLDVIARLIDELEAMG